MVSVGECLARFDYDNQYGRDKPLVRRARGAQHDLRIKCLWISISFVDTLYNHMQIRISYQVHFLWMGKMKALGRRENGIWKAIKKLINIRFFFFNSDFRSNLYWNVAAGGCNASSLQVPSLTSLMTRERFDRRDSVQDVFECFRETIFFFITIKSRFLFKLWISFPSERGQFALLGPLVRGNSLCINGRASKLSSCCACLLWGHSIHRQHLKVV